MRGGAGRVPDRNPVGPKQLFFCNSERQSIIMQHERQPGKDEVNVYGFVPSSDFCSILPAVVVPKAKRRRVFSLLDEPLIWGSEPAHAIAQIIQQRLATNSKAAHESLENNVLGKQFNSHRHNLNHKLRCHVLESFFGPPKLNQRELAEISGN